MNHPRESDLAGFSRMVTHREPERSIGDLIRQACDLDDGEIDAIVDYQHKHGIRFGEAAIELQLASEQEVMHALSTQFQYPFVTGKGLNSELIAALDPFGEDAEAFREARSQLLMGGLNYKGHRRALAVLSPNIGDGKTYFVANLAIAFSQLGGRTLLVDANLRNPRQHELFDAPSETALSTVLAGRGKSRVLHQVAELPNLYILPAGAQPPNPLELVQRPTFGFLMQELMDKFDHVLVDTPAMTYGSDAKVIAAKCGAAMVLARRGRTRMKDAQALLTSLGKGPTQICGLMVNEY